MSAITSHVLETSLGKPAVGVRVALARWREPGLFEELGRGLTDSEGRVRQLLGDHQLDTGLHTLTFETGAYYRAAGRETFYDRIEIRFHVTDASQHYHVPLLLSPFGYSTYRGS